MIGSEYISTGITCKWRDSASRGPDGISRSGWAASLNFTDAGFCDDNADAARVSTEGTLCTRYYVADGEQANGLTVALDTLIADAQRLGISFRITDLMPAALYVQGDGEDPDVDLPHNWRDVLRTQAERLGFDFYWSKDRA